MPGRTQGTQSRGKSPALREECAISRKAATGESPCDRRMVLVPPFHSGTPGRPRQAGCTFRRMRRGFSGGRGSRQRLMIGLSGFVPCHPRPQSNCQSAIVSARGKFQSVAGGGQGLRKPPCFGGFVLCRWLTRARMTKPVETARDAPRRAGRSARRPRGGFRDREAARRVRCRCRAAAPVPPGR